MPYLRKTEAPPVRETIFALSSGRPPAAIAVVRISGPQALDAVSRLCSSPPLPRRAGLRALHDPATGELLDRALVLLFPGPASETGDDLAELQLHGSPAVVARVLAALSGLPGLKPAEPGGFTRRAFDNGRIDLTQVEGLADLLSAETERQRLQALRLMEGGLGAQCEHWRDQLLDLLALVEADLDFADEDDVTALDLSSIKAQASSIANQLDQWLSRPTADRLRDGVRVVVSGPPNAGKSSLINALARREVAIVTPIAGTTRDLIEVPLAIHGLPFLLIDTAGLRDSADPIEREGVKRAERAIASADIVLAMGEDAASIPVRPDGGPIIMSVASKCDLRGKPAGWDGETLNVSATSGAGLDMLLETLALRAEPLIGRGDEPLLANQRQADALRDCRAALERLGDIDDPVLIAEELRSSLSALARLVGRMGVEDMLDRLFSRFCIGK